LGDEGALESTTKETGEGPGVEVKMLTKERREKKGGGGGKKKGNL